MFLARASAISALRAAERAGFARPGVAADQHRSRPRRSCRAAASSRRRARGSCARSACASVTCQPKCQIALCGAVGGGASTLSNRIITSFGENSAGMAGPARPFSCSGTAGRRNRSPRRDRPNSGADGESRGSAAQGLMASCVSSNLRALCRERRRDGKHDRAGLVASDAAPRRHGAASLLSSLRPAC